jgi:hypothetical protein
MILPGSIQQVFLCSGVFIPWFMSRGCPDESEETREHGQDSMPDSLPVLSSDTDWREFRARLIASQAVSTSGRTAEQVQHPISLFRGYPCPFVHENMFIFISKLESHKKGGSRSREV